MEKIVEEKLETKIDLKAILEMRKSDLEEEIEKVSNRYNKIHYRLSKMHKLLDDLQRYRRTYEWDEFFNEFRILSDDQEKKIITQINEKIMVAKEEWQILSLLLAIYNEKTRLEGNYEQMKHCVYSTDRINGIKY